MEIICEHEVGWHSLWSWAMHWNKKEWWKNGHNLIQQFYYSSMVQIHCSSFLFSLCMRLCTHAGEIWNQGGASKMFPSANRVGETAAVDKRVEWSGFRMGESKSSEQKWFS